MGSEESPLVTDPLSYVISHTLSPSPILKSTWGESRYSQPTELIEELWGSGEAGGQKAGSHHCSAQGRGDPD